MKRLAISLFILLFIPLQGHSTEETRTVQVQSTGPSYEDAKQQGFKRAIEYVVGTMVISTQEARDQQLVREEILNYSAGYIDDYEITGQEQVNGVWQMDMLVKVKSSKLAHRFLVSSNPEYDIDGGKLNTQIQSILHERYSGDAVLLDVLNGFPHNSFVINSGQAHLNFNSKRQPYLTVPYEIKWSRLWLEALAEALATTSQNSRTCSGWVKAIADGVAESNVATSVRQSALDYCGETSDIRISTPGRFFNNTYHFRLEDPYRLELINQQFTPPLGAFMLGLNVDLVNHMGETLARECLSIKPGPLLIYRNNKTIGIVNYKNKAGTMQIDLNGPDKVSGQVSIYPDPSYLDQVEKLKFTIGAQCSS